MHTCHTQCPQPCSRPHRPRPPRENPGHSWANLGQSLVGSLLLSPGSWCAQGSVHDLSHSQLPVLFLLTVYSFSIFGCKEHNQSDFGIDHLVMSMCRVLCFWKRVFAMTSAFSWQNSIGLCPASFCTPRPNIPVVTGISSLPTFAFQSPIMKRTYFLDISSRRSCRSL